MTLHCDAGSGLITQIHASQKHGGAMTTRPRHGERGLTLVELLVVLLILGLIAAFAVPRLMRYVGSARADAAAIQISRLDGILEL